MVAVLLKSHFKSFLVIAACLVLSVFCASLLYTPPLEFQRRLSPPESLANPSYGLIRPLPLSEKPKYAIATFLSHDPTEDWDQSDVQNDYNFIGTRILTYQLLYANETRLRDPTIPFIVLTTPTVSAAKRQQLLLDGATLINVDTPPLPEWLHPQETFQSYGADQFAKLRLFALLQYDRILFLSPNTFLTQPVDAIFADVTLRTPSTSLAAQRPHEIKPDEGPLPANYLFAARTDTSISNRKDPYWHDFPALAGNIFTCSSLVFAPSLELYSLLLSTLHTAPFKSVMRRFLNEKWNRKNPWMRHAGPEHALLNYAFRRDGTMPWQELDPRWASSWGSEGDLDASVVAMSGEYWWSGPLKVRDVWVEWRGRMEAEFA